MSDPFTLTCDPGGVNDKSDIVTNVGSAIIEHDGVISNADGLNVHDVRQHLVENGGLKDFPAGDYSANEAAALEIDCDILIPAAIEAQIHAGNAMQIKARMVIEGANGPVTFEADEILRR